MSRARIALTMVTVVALVVAALGGIAAWRGWFSEPSVPSAPDAAPASVTDVVTDLRAPWGLAFRPDGSALVTERDTARILTVRGGSATELTVVDEAAPAGEGGLLGIAAAGDWVYVYYTADGDNRVARFHPDRPDTRETIFTGIPKAGNHNGGRIALGPDGMLYVGTGDAGDRDTAQDRGSLGGKILRLTPDGAPAPGNPFGATPVYSYGHRNVQGLAWDASGAMFASEFGQNTYDELNRIEPGRNYGWPEAEGDSTDPAFTNPIATWRTADASPSGIAVGPDGRVWMACLRGERLYMIGTDGGGAQALLRDEHGRLRHVAAAPDGSMWVLTSNHDGRGDPAPGDDRILRITV
ncbi:PQQ-dependent sugar dehydrogenase [Asanoa sp. NPDC049518]|uniref:PQQ-dependent sugar dehydrogenase n=1 Tax=unclassified Asanoa TaxID=2685164 RepID=UPI003446B84A